MPLPPLPLLLQTTMPAPAAVPPVLLFALALGGFAFGVWSWFRRESREDRGKRDAATEAHFAKLEKAQGAFVDEEVLEKRFATIESKHALVAVELINQRNTLHEAARADDRFKAETENQMKQLQRDAHLLQPVPGRVQNLEAKFDQLTERIATIRDGLTELRDGQKENKKEILDAIKQARP